METQWTLAYKIFKTSNDQNPNFMKEMFYRFPKLTHRKNTLYVHSRNTVKFGNKSVKLHGAYIWNSVPENIISTKSPDKVKDFMKKWSGPQVDIVYVVNLLVPVVH